MISSRLNAPLDVEAERLQRFERVARVVGVEAVA